MGLFPAYPHAVCKIIVEVYKKLTVEEINRFDPSKGIRKPDWTQSSEAIRKPTTIHVTLPPNSQSVTFCIKTNNADHSAAYQTTFTSTAVEVFEEKPSKSAAYNRFIFLDVEKTKAELPKDAGEQTVTIGKDSDYEVASSAIVKDATENKANS